MPHVTIIRPCKGFEPCLDDCLRSSLQQDYPREKLTIYFCVATRQDPAVHTIQRVLAEHPDHDAKLLVEEDDEVLQQKDPQLPTLGPNPKIRNMSRAYREAKGDFVWILDCNIWINQGACGRMVDKLCGLSNNNSERPHKLVHHLPVAIDIPVVEAFAHIQSSERHLATPHKPIQNILTTKETYLGGRLDEAFLSSAHAKMYIAINTVAVAPCICGKSSMFRRSHLNALTNDDQSTDTRFGSGIDFFSENICEDHLIGDLLWKASIPSSMPPAAKMWKNHGLICTDIAFQPVSAMTISAYIARRVRWLRVRKFTVPAATLVEPGTEAVLCSAMGAFGFTKSLWTQDYVRSSLSVFAMLWLGSLLGWAAVDLAVYKLLQSQRTIERSGGKDQAVPPFVNPLNKGRRSVLAWAASWLAREFLTLPIWLWAIWGGATVIWRDKKLWVGFDMKVHEVIEPGIHEQQQPLLSGDLHNGLQSTDVTGMGDAYPKVSANHKVRRD